jgi:hypothetical protein
MEPIGEALWLAGREIRRNWRSYPVTELFMLVFGLLLVAATEGLSGIEDPGASGARLESWYDAFMPDFLFLTWCSLLAISFMSRDYITSWTGPFSKRLIFLRSLPIPTKGLVMARMLGAALAALLIGFLLWGAATARRIQRRDLSA